MSVQKHQRAKQHIDRRLLIRLRIFCVIFLVTVGVIIVDVRKDIIETGLAFSGILIGISIGIVVGRMYSLSWDENTAKVIA